ncbi:hypothetical protein G6F59_013183 [Rhizopus arrhizus]|nr:hypothetical protein G6F59_013183 [Rhizopus arrhizus]
MAATTTDDQAGLDRVGNDDDRAAFVEQFVRNALFRDSLDFGQHTHGVAGALVFLRSGHGLAGQQTGGDQQGLDRATHGRLQKSVHRKI